MERKRTKRGDLHDRSYNKNLIKGSHMNANKEERIVLQNNVALGKKDTPQQVFNQGVLTLDNYKKRVIKDYVLHSNGKKQYPADKRPSIDTCVEIIKELGFKPRATKKGRVKSHDGFISHMKRQFADVQAKIKRKLEKAKAKEAKVVIKKEGEVSKPKAENFHEPKGRTKPARRTKKATVSV